MPLKSIDFNHQAFGGPEFGPSRSTNEFSGRKGVISEGHAAFKGTSWDVEDDVVSLQPPDMLDSAAEDVDTEQAITGDNGCSAVEIELWTPPAEHIFRIGDELL